MRRRPRTAVPAGTVDVAASDAVPTVPPFLEVKLAGTRVLLARRRDGRVVAFTAACPHLGQPLRRAELDGTVVTCRHHRYRFDLTDGRCVWPGDPHDEGLELHETGEIHGRVWVRPPAGRS